MNPIHSTHASHSFGSLRAKRHVVLPPPFRHPMR